MECIQERFSTNDLITLCCIANRTNKTIDDPTDYYSDIFEANVMTKILGKKAVLTYEKDIATDAEMFYSTQENLIIFKATDSKLDWKSNFKIIPTQCEQIDQILHKGFTEQFNTLSPTLLKQDFDKDTILTITGHSLGGALASIAAVCFCQLGYNVRLRTFGAPRAGFCSFRDYYAAHTFLQFGRIQTYLNHQSPENKYGIMIKNQLGVGKFNNTYIDAATYIQLNDPVPLLPKWPYVNPMPRIILGNNGKVMSERQYKLYKWNIFSRIKNWLKKKPQEYHDVNNYKKQIIKGNMPKE